MRSTWRNPVCTTASTTVIVLLILCLAGCGIKNYSAIGLKEYKLNDQGFIFIDSKEFAPVQATGFSPIRAADAPFAIAKDGDEYPYTLYKINDARDGEWFYAHQHGLMMNWGWVYRLSSIPEPDFGSYKIDKILFSTGDIPWPFTTPKIEETITDAGSIGALKKVLLGDPAYLYDDYEIYDLNMSYLRNVYLLSSDYPGLAYICALTRNENDGKTYLDKDFKFYDVNDVLDIIW
jgi:hypothetical protein